MHIHLPTFIAGGSLTVFVLTFDKVVWPVFKDWLRKRRVKESDRTTADARIEVARVDALTQKEERLDSKAFKLIDDLQQQIDNMRIEMHQLRDTLKVEAEDRKMAEITAEVAHVRADDAERKLVQIKAKLALLQSEYDAQNDVCGHQAARIKELECRVKELENEVSHLYEDIKESENNPIP